MTAHNTSGLDCWCEPNIEERCPACLHLPPINDEGAVPGCWQCVWTAWVPKFSDRGPFMVIHRTNQVQAP